MLREPIITVSSLAWFFQLLLLLVLKQIVTDDQLFLRILSVATIFWFAVLYFSSVRLEHNRNWMVIPILFYFSYWLVFFSIPMIEAFDVTVELRRLHIIRQSQWPDVAYSAALGILSFFFGYELRLQQAQLNTPKLIANTVQGSTVYLSGWLMLIISFLSFGVFYISGGAAMYGGEYTGTKSLSWTVSVTHIVFNSCFQIAICLWAIYYTNHNLQDDSSKSGYMRVMLPLFFLAILLLFVLSSGSRSLIVFCAIIFMVVYSQYRPVNTLNFLALTFAAFSFYSIMQLLRIPGDKDVALVMSVLSEINFLDAILMFPLSTAPSLTNAFEYVEQYGGFQGMFFLQGLLSVLPLYTKIFPMLPGAGDFALGSSSNFITTYVFGFHKYGLGTTVISDIYLDFGNSGIIILMFTLGIVSKFIYSRRYSYPFGFGMLSYGLFVPALMYSTRGAVTYPLRILWMIVLGYVLLRVMHQLVLRIYRKRGH